MRKATNDSGEEFLSARVASKYRKAVFYYVNIKIKNYKAISDTQCECASGRGPTAHCEHVCLVFEAMKDFIKNKCLKLRETSTEKFQSFHQPKAKYTGSPVEAVNLKLCRINKPDEQLKDFDPRPIKRRKINEYPTNFRNSCINFAGLESQTFPELQLFKPANFYALYDDHDYFKKHKEDNFF